MKNKNFKDSLGKDEFGFAICKQISFRKFYILKTYGWRTSSDFTCYCPVCEGYSIKRKNQRSWKNYRKTQYKSKLNLI